MNIICEILIFILIFFVVPYMIGTLYANRGVGDHLEGLSYVMYYYVIGFITMLALFELLCVPMSIAQIRLHILLITFTVLIIILCLWAGVRIIKNRRIVFVPYTNINIDGTTILYFIIALIIIGMQLFYVVYYQSNWMSGDDFEYVTRTSSSLYTDMIVTRGAYECNIGIVPRRSFNSWEIFIAWLCRLSGINVPTMVHTVLNVSLVAVVFAVFYLMGRVLFDSYKESIIFLDVVAFTNLFGLYSHYSLTFRWLMTMWQGKAVFMALIFQFLFVFMLYIANDEFCLRNMIVLIVLSLASCSVTPTGVGMFMGAIAMIIIIFCIAKKRLWYIKYLIASVIFPAMFFAGYVYFI